MSAEWALRLTPEPFRDFVPYTSLSALKVIHTGQVLERALRIVSSSDSDGARRSRAERLGASLCEANLKVRVASSPVQPLSVGTLSPESRAAIGEQVLRLYFQQLYAGGAWFLDLRPRHFSWNEEAQELTFFPSNLWFEPDSDFRRRVQSLYEGFYRGDRAALRLGLELYSWKTRARDGYSERLELLLRRHFGAGEGREVRFASAHFRETFDQIFQEAALSGAKLHPELTFLGVALIGLYLTLESLQVPLDPHRAFEASTP
jgi:hypothetical protein